MQIGYNNDVDFEGVRYHIQTEDHGLTDGRITSLVFRQGAIVESMSVSYLQQVEDIEDPEQRDEAIRKRMRAMHKVCYRNIKAGKYITPPQPDEAAAETPATTAGEALPGDFSDTSPEPLLVADDSAPADQSAEADGLALLAGADISALLEEAVPVAEAEVHETGEPTDRMEPVAPDAAPTATPLAAVLASRRQISPDLLATRAAGAKATPPPVPPPVPITDGEPAPEMVDGFVVAGVQSEMDAALIAEYSRGLPLEALEEPEIQELPATQPAPLADDDGDHLDAVAALRLHPTRRAFRGLDVDPDRELTTLIELWARRIAEAP